MAKIIIPQSKSQVKVGAATQTGALALPILQLSQTVASGYKALGKVVEDIHREQVATEDNAQFQEIVKKAVVDIEMASANASKNTTDVKLAVDTFEKLTQPEKWNELTNGKRKRVKTKFNQWLNKQKNSEYVSITKAVTANHVKFVKQSNNDFINDLVLKAASTNIYDAQNAISQLLAWFADPANSVPYSIEEWKKFEEDTLKTVQDLQYTYGAKNNPDFTVKNQEEISKVLGPAKAKKLVETAKLKIVSDINELEKNEKAEIKYREDTKIANFTEILLRLQGLNNPALILDDAIKTDTTIPVPSLDLINDLWKEDKLNTSQYRALIRFATDPEYLGSEEIYDLINKEIMLADSVEQHDAIQRKFNLSPQYLASLGIKDIKTITNILEKSKDRQVFQDMKYYHTVLDDILGKLDSTGYFQMEGSEDPKADKKLRTKAHRLYNEYLDQNLSPEDAFQKVAKGFLLQNNRLPTIFDVSLVSSINVLEPSDAQKKGKPEDTFEDWRTQVVDQYKNKNISFNEMLSDLENLDVMEDIFGIRQGAAKELKIDPWGSDNSQQTGTKKTKL